MKKGKVPYLIITLAFIVLMMVSFVLEVLCLAGVFNGLDYIMFMGAVMVLGVSSFVFTMVFDHPDGKAGFTIFLRVYALSLMALSVILSFVLPQ